jgi:GNAT superfamily N-acetyltransferase
MDDITITNLQLPDMVLPVELASREQWNPGRDDGEFLFRADSKGFFAAVKGNQVLGTIASVKYENNTGFIGLHIVLPEHRNKGVGENLLKTAVDKSKDLDIGINCKPDQIKYYERFGFKPAFKIYCYEGIADGNFRMSPEITSPFTLPFDLLYDYCRNTFPYERKTFTSYWLNQPKSLLLCKYENEKIKGFGLFKPCINGYKLSPLISDDPGSAEEILTALQSHFPLGTPYYLYIPEPNIESNLLVEKFKMKKVSEIERMYLNNEHNILLNNVYSFFNLEVG